MCEHEQIFSIPAVTHGSKNAKGRPRKLQSVTFSTQPRSIVSLTIEKMIKENKIALPIRWQFEKKSIKSSPIEKEDRNNSTLPEIDSLCLVQTQKNESKSDGNIKPKMYSCDFTNCLYSSKLFCNLQKHKRTHTGEKPYLCDTCSFRTNFSNSLKVHKRLHTGERPYQCKNCVYKCNSISNLKKHNHTKHKTLVL